MSLRQSLLCLTFISLGSAATAGNLFNFTHDAKQALAEELEAYKYQDLNTKKLDKIKADQKEWATISADRETWLMYKRQRTGHKTGFDDMYASNKGGNLLQRLIYKHLTSKRGSKQGDSLQDTYDLEFTRNSASSYYEPRPSITLRESGNVIAY